MAARLCKLCLCFTSQGYLYVDRQGYLYVDRTQGLHVSVCLQDGLYPLLLRFIDTASTAQGIASMALQLLAVLPTYRALSERLAASLDGPGGFVSMQATKTCGLHL